jgi:hypothetical protein
MKSAVILAGAALALGACSQQAPSSNQQSATTAQRPSDAESEAYMRKAEADWAELAVRPIPGLLDRILADDYVAVSSKGDVRDKAAQLKLDPPDPDYRSSKLDYVHYRHFGDTVIAQGGESLQRKDGGPDHSLIWTDVWMWRDGKWQVVASQDNVVPPERK